MQIDGKINTNDELLAPISVTGSRKRALVWAIVDTGFSGSLSLPLDLIANLGMELDGSANYQLADGTVKPQLLFRATVRWKGKTKRIKANLTFSDEILLGTELLKNGKLIGDYKNGKCQIEY